MQVKEYDLFIDLDFERLTFKGKVLINLETEQDAVLNSVGLEIFAVKSAGRSISFKQRGEELVVATGPFNGALQVDYSGPIPDSLAGIYRAKYDHSHIVTTHFESAQARRMFPCIDRPDMKAEFKLAVRISKDLDAISNMPIESVKPDGGKAIVTFQKTPRMSTYLLYLGVGKFQVQSEKLGNTEILLAVPGKAAPSRVPLEEARKAIEYFNSYYGLPYSLPKVHLVSVPEFAMGAMENWGAITFREIYTLIDDNTTTRMRMQSSLAVAHELAHQWFGDLVTMKWWDDVWLNESFASFMAYKAVDSIHPDWRIRENSYNGLPRAETLAAAMGRDSLKTTHPIHVPVKSPDEIEQVFDAISYGKGCHLLRMIEGYIGEDAFRQGIHQYLSAYAYANATRNDLWSSLAAASGKEMTKIMSFWVEQPGYPLVTVSLDHGELSLQQERFLLSGESEGGAWPIPLILELNGERKEVLLETRQKTMEVEGLKSLKVNPDHIGFYAVRYSGLEELLWRSRLSPYDRWGIVFDAFMFLFAEKITFNEYLSLLRRFIDESGTLPAKEVSNQLALLYELIPDQVIDLSTKFHRSQLNILQSKTDQNSTMLLGIIASRLSLIDPEYANILGGEFRRYRDATPDMKLAIVTAYARSTNDFDSLSEEYRKSGSDEDKDRLLNAMTAFTDEATLQKTFDFAFSGAVKRQDVRYVIIYAIEKPQAKALAWACLQSNIEKLQSLYKNTGTLSDTLQLAIPILGIGRTHEVKRFFEENKIPEADAGIKAGVEKLLAYDQFVNRITRG